jgi:ribosome recycling factor
MSRRLLCNRGILRFIRMAQPNQFIATAQIHIVPMSISGARCFHASPAAFAPKKGKASKAAAATDDDDEEEVELPDIADMDEKMERQITYFVNELAKISGGRASSDMVNFVVVDAYGDKMPITDVAQVSLKTPTKLLISVFDSDITSHVAQAVRDCGLGLAPIVEGTNITLNIPKQSKEARASLVKIVAKQGEGIKADIRSARKNFMDKVKGLKGKVSEDELRRMGKEVDGVTEQKTDKVTKLIKAKEQDILSS